MRTIDVLHRELTGERLTDRCSQGRLLRWLAVGVAAGLLAFAFPAVAGATDYCVDAVPACGPKNVASFQEALDKAAAATDADRVFLGASTYTAPVANGFAYDNPGGPVEIIGAGQDSSTPTIVTSAPGASDHVLRLMGGPGSSLHDLKIELPPTAISGLRGLETNATARRITVVDAATVQTTPRVGVLLRGGVLEDSLVVLNTNSDGVILVDGAGAVRGSRITASIGLSSDGGVVERTDVNATTTGVVLQRNQTTIRSSQIRVSGGNATGFYAIVQPGSDTTVIADGVDLLGPAGPGATGVRAETAYAPASSVSVTLTNSLLRGFPKALYAYAANYDTGSARIDASYSDYDASKNMSSGTNATITQTNVSNVGDVGFADVGDDDYRLLPGSPLVDAGDPATAQGLDLRGNPLLTDGNLDGTARRDIGAFELPGPLPGAGDQAPLGADPPPGGGGVDREAPLLSGFVSTHKLFAVGAARTAISAAAARGTRFRYTLSEPARVTIKIQRALPGRRRQGSCVRPSPQLRGAKPCKRYRTVGMLTRTGKQGQNSTTFTGRLGSRALPPGTYRAVARATDEAQNRSVPKRSSFRIVHG